MYTGMKVASTVKDLYEALRSVKPATAPGYDHLEDDYYRRSVSTAHKHLHLDHVMIVAREGGVTVYTENADRCMFAHVPATVAGDGAFAVPLKPLMQWLYTCPPSETVTLSHTGDKESFSRGYGDEREYVTVCMGRNRARFVGINAEQSCVGPDFADVQECATCEMQYRDGATCEIRWEYGKPPTKIDRFTSPGYAAESLNAAVYAKPRVRVTLAQMQAAAPAPVQEPAPINRPAHAPTTLPATIYTPAVGDTVFIVLRHENGTTTDRVVDVQRLTAGGFRGHDRRYGKVRNYYTQHIALCRKWDGQALFDHNGEEVVSAA